jgi:hypothetical protein
MTIWRISAAVVAVIASLAATAVAGPGFSAWAPAQKVDEINHNSTELNTPFIDGCPIQSPDGLSLYMASTRPRFPGDTRTDLDIWVAQRKSRHAAFGEPVNLGAAINSTADDFCPTPVRRGLYFVSRKTTGESCGLGDIYFASFSRKAGWSEPKHLACTPEGPNSALDEQGPSYVEAGSRFLLYFSSSSATVPGDIFVSERSRRGKFGPAALVTALSSPGNDIQPNVRKDGLEVVFSSNHAFAGAQGAQDVYVSTRGSTEDSWSAPLNLGAAVNTAASETRPSLSWDARTLYFGRAPGPEGMSDIYVSTRMKATD